MEGRPARLGLGAKVPRKSQVGAILDPVERRLHKKFGAGRKKPAAGDEDSVPPPKIEIDNGDEDDDENIDSRTNSFAKKRPALPPTTPQSKKKHK